MAIRCHELAGTRKGGTSSGYTSTNGEIDTRGTLALLGVGIDRVSLGLPGGVKSRELAVPFATRMYLPSISISLLGIFTVVVSFLNLTYLEKLSTLMSLGVGPAK